MKSTRFLLHASLILTSFGMGSLACSSGEPQEQEKPAIAEAPAEAPAQEGDRPPPAAAEPVEEPVAANLPVPAPETPPEAVEKSPAPEKTPATEKKPKPTARAVAPTSGKESPAPPAPPQAAAVPEPTPAAKAVVSAGTERTFLIREDGPSRVSFASDAPLEKINGSSGKVSGSVSVDPDNLAKVSGRLEVPVASLNTGLALRDEHLHSDKWLDAKGHPKIVVEITGVDGATKLEPNKATNLKLRGRITLKGITRPLVATAVVKRVPQAGGDVLQAKSQFTVKLSAHNVSIPAIVKMKVAEEIKVNATIEAVAR